MFSHVYPHSQFHQLVNHLASPYSYRPATQCSRRRNYGRPSQYWYPTQYQIIVPVQEEEVSTHTEIDPRVKLSYDDAAYDIHVEIPGFAKEQVDVEFTDSKTLRVSGSTKSEETVQSTQEGISGDQEKQTAPIPAEAAEGASTRSASPQPKRTSIEDVRDESESGFVEVDATRPHSPTFTNSRTVSPAPQPEQATTVAQTTSAAPAVAKPVHTRSFVKTFDIPRDAERDQVQAELKDGILHIRIARLSPEVSRKKIQIA